MLRMVCWHVVPLCLMLVAEPLVRADSIRITDFEVTPARLKPGETLTVSVMAEGNANFCLRHDLQKDQKPPRTVDPGPPLPGDRNGGAEAPDEPREGPLPGWKAHGSDYAFLPSTDFTGPGPWKNPEFCHRDNGHRDLDPRKGVFTVKVDTDDWPQGTYHFQIQATNRPEVGPHVGDVRSFQIVVGEANVAPGISGTLELRINGHRCADGDAGWEILPGRPNRLTVALLAAERPSPLFLTLVRTLPDGRSSRRSVSLSGESPKTTLDLGLFAVPTEFDFEAGVLYHCGTRFRLDVRESPDAEPLETVLFHQTVHDESGVEVLSPGAPERVVHRGNRGTGVQPLDPPILLWLAPQVLSNQDDVRIRYQLRSTERRIHPEQSMTRIPALLRITAENEQQPLLEEPVEVLPKLGERAVDVTDWPAGRYRIEVLPQVEESSDRAGPAVVYRRGRNDGDSVRLSPLAPWSFDRDATRPELVINDFPEAIERWSAGLPANGSWTVRETGGGQTALVTEDGDWQQDPVTLRPKLQGTYAVFAATEGGNCFVRVGRGGMIRGVLAKSCYVDVAEMSENEVAIYPAAVPGSGLRELRFIPVTPDSVDRVLSETSQPPIPLRGVADWCDYFAPPSVHHSGGGRLRPDQFETLLKGHTELGLSSVGWSIGRSWVEYHSDLPTTTRFPCVPLETIAPKYQQAYAGRTTMINTLDPLDYVLQRRAKYGVEILPWLSMQRHYGENAYGGIFCSEWFRSHPQWRRWSKNASAPSGSTVSYYFPEVRRERVDIFCEVAERSPDGLLIGWCRQVPMILYHPEMVAQYQAETGVDPQKIDAGDDKEYREWIRWRADFVTETLRELQERLAPIRRQTNRPIPVVVRIPSKGLFYNMAQGLDVETWCREGLIDQIHLDPLEDCGWRGEPHDVQPYLELGRRFEIPVYGGINGNTFKNEVAILRRALGLHQAGVAGIELYESNNFAAVSPRRWIIPLLGHPARLEEFLKSSNIEACFPVWSRNAASGYDNHSFSGNWSVYGMGGSSL